MGAARALHPSPQITKLRGPDPGVVVQTWRHVITAFPGIRRVRFRTHWPERGKHPNVDEPPPLMIASDDSQLNGADAMYSERRLELRKD